jgi:hypothetical protein
MAKVFISYSRKDIEFAKRLTEELQKSDLDFWVDWEGIPPTVDWWQQIEKGIVDADAFLFLISPDSATSKVCEQEINCAVSNGKRLIPLVVHDIGGHDAPRALSHLNWIFFRKQDDFDAGINKLLTAIHTDYDWVQTHRRLQVRALEWERSQREPSFLLRGKDLQEAEAQLTVNGEKPPHPTDLQREYVAQSSRVQTEQAEQQRAREQQIELEQKMGIRLRRLTYLLIGVFTAAFIALFLWLNTMVGDFAVNSIKDQMLAIAETSVSFIDGDQYEILVNSYSEGDEAVLQDEYYLALIHLIENVISRNENIVADAGIYFITRADNENEILFVASDFEHYKSAWEVDSNSVQRSGLEETSANTEIYIDQYGSWVSSCTPIFNSSENSVGALCVDIEASVVAETRREVTNTLLIAFVAIYPAMIGIVFLATRSLSKKRRGIVKAIPHR